MDAELKDFLKVALSIFTCEEWDDILNTSFRKTSFQSWLDGAMVPADDLNSLVYVLDMNSKLTEQERFLLEKIKVKYARYLLEPMEDAMMKLLRCLPPEQEGEMLYKISEDVMRILNEKDCVNEG